MLTAAADVEQGHKRTEASTHVGATLLPHTRHGWCLMVVLVLTAVVCIFKENFAHGPALFHAHGMHAVTSGALQPARRRPHSSHSLGCPSNEKYSEPRTGGRTDELILKSAGRCYSTNPINPSTFETRTFAPRGHHE